MYLDLNRGLYLKRLSVLATAVFMTTHSFAQTTQESEGSGATSIIIIILCILIIASLVFFIIKQQIKSKSIQHQLKEEIESLRKEVVDKKEEAEKAQKEKQQDRLILKRVTLLFLKKILQRVEEVLPSVREINDRPTLPANFPNVQNLYRNAIMIKAVGEQLEDIYIGQMDDTEGKVEIAPYSIQRILYEVNQKLIEIIDTNQIVYRFNKFARPELKVYVNKEKLSFTLRNLLLNAFNHIQHRGMVTLTVSEEISDDNSTCLIDISYSAKLPIKKVGELANEDCPIFDINAIELGWEFMEDNINKFGGKIEFKSEEGATNIVLTIPTIAEKVKDLEAVKIIDIPEDTDVEEKAESDKDDDKPTKQSNNEAKISNALESQNNDEPDQSPELFENSGAQQKNRNTILIISDRQEIVTYMKVLLSTTYNITTASTGQEGIDKAKNEKPDMIMCDVEVPGTGFHVCEEIRADVSTCHLPFILVTSKVEDDDLVRGLEIGADDYMLKPFTPGLIKAKIENLIKNRRVMRQKYSNLMVQLNGHDDENVEGGNGHNKFIKDVVRLIEDNILEPDFNVKKLASSLNMSQPTLYRKVKQQTNCTIIELIIGVRIRRAALFLKEGNYSVQEVAEKVGYNDVSTFRKNFVEIMGATPSAYAGQS